MSSRCGFTSLLQFGSLNQSYCGTVASSATPSADVLSVEKRLCTSFRATFAANFQRVDLLFESLPLPLPLFAEDDSSMHAAGECTVAWRAWLSRTMAPAGAHVHILSPNIHDFSSFLARRIYLDRVSCASRRPS
jgi:hypothetical protein